MSDPVWLLPPSAFTLSRLFPSKVTKIPIPSFFPQLSRELAQGSEAFAILGGLHAKSLAHVRRAIADAVTQERLYDEPHIELILAARFREYPGTCGVLARVRVASSWTQPYPHNPTFASAMRGVVARVAAAGKFEPSARVQRWIAREAAMIWFVRQRRRWLRPSDDVLPRLRATAKRWAELAVAATARRLAASDPTFDRAIYLGGYDRGQDRIYCEDAKGLLQAGVCSAEIRIVGARRALFVRVVRPHAQTRVWSMLVQELRARELDHYWRRDWSVPHCGIFRKAGRAFEEIPFAEQTPEMLAEHQKFVESLL